MKTTVKLTPENAATLSWCSKLTGLPAGSSGRSHFREPNPFVFALALDVLRLLDQHPDLDIAQVDAKGLVPTASQLDEFAQLGGRTELCHVE
jgi:hypothetical protein